jgi:dephospho-CoA kinase
MLRVGLTGGLGSGKSTAARMFAERGAQVLSSDAMGRELMEPGQAVYAEIVARFGQGVVLATGALDRPALARLAFEQGRVEELNAIVHPAVIARQEELLCGLERDAVVVIESALIFETRYGTSNGAGWRERFDRMVLVMAPMPVKIARFLERAGATAETRDALEAEARRRLAVQMPDEEKIPFCDYVLRNDGDMAWLEVQVERVWQELLRAAVTGN